MNLESIWRLAAVAAGVAELVERVGPTVIDTAGVESLAVRVIDREATRLDTTAWIRRGHGGLSRPDAPQVQLREVELERVRVWVSARKLEQASNMRASAIARELLRGLGAPSDGRWWLVPINCDGDAYGALVIHVLSDAKLDRRQLASIAEAIAVVAARERAQRELQRMREAVEAERAAALTRMQTRDIGVAVIGAETGLRDVMRQVEQVAPTQSPVLILGETGSGKEVVARAIHDRSVRARGPILRVNCGAISPELIDSELFGHERGSFTGAIAQRSGWFERADGGTLFLDEIAELPLAAQVRLLRVVQDGVFERVGGTRSLRVDVRVIAATHRDLGSLVERGAFREDLWYRINVFMIRLPALRERQGDIAALAEHFAAREARRAGAAPPTLSEADLALLRAYDWPGNVRELGAVIERAAILGDAGKLDIARALGISGTEGLVFPSLSVAIKRHIERALEQCRGRIDGPRGAARLLGVNPNTLRSKIQKLGVSVDAFRPNFD